MLPNKRFSNERNQTAEVEQPSSTNIVDNSNNPETTEIEADIFDPAIVSDREANMHVTSWVRENYVQERDHNVPRRNMYEHYKAHCLSSQLTAVNSATFGKLIRSVFPDLKTRRLGVRGQSKYHYCGIRVRASSETHSTIDPILAAAESSRRFDDRSTLSISTSNPSDSPISIHIPIFAKPAIVSYPINNALDDSVTSFIAAYERHCKDILISVTNHQVGEMDGIMGQFYDNMPNSFRFLIRDIPEITEAAWRYDSLFYDTIIERFLPNINYPLTQRTMLSLRMFTRELTDHITAHVSQFPINFFQKKLDVARIFAAKFRRHLSLNQAAQTASVILSMPDHLLAMRKDWEVFDFDGLLDQTLWVCDCNVAEIRHILSQEVYDLLTVKISLDQWMHWISNIVDNHLNKYVPASPNDANHYLTQAKQFLLKWAFYTSLVMKDLARQSARSFNSFHTLRLFLDEYALYLVEENIAQINYLLLKQQQAMQRAESSSSSIPSHSGSFKPSSSSTHNDHHA